MCEPSRRTRSPYPACAACALLALSLRERRSHQSILSEELKRIISALTSTWWKHGVIYQVYPRSFLDTNGDGIGDLEGIIRRLDYLAWLGADAIWVSPIYPSPMADFGYDVTDYCDIAPVFGDLPWFVRFIGVAHWRRFKVVLDLVS